MRHRKLLLGGLVASLLPATAFADTPYVSPYSPTKPAKPASSTPKPIVIIPKGGGPSRPDGEAADEVKGSTPDFILLGDDFATQPWEQQSWTGPVPEHHVVRSGDTLWDIAWMYYNNPFEWPRMWSYNKSITNPHYIYPGELVRLRGELVRRTPQPAANTRDPVQPSTRVRLSRTNSSGAVDLRQLAYLDRERLELDGKITGAVEERVMLSTGDHVYMSYTGKAPKIGERFAVYAPKQSVKHPKSGKQTGSYVRILGELRVVSVQRNLRARAVIESSVDVIERGERVGKIQRRFRGTSVKQVLGGRTGAGSIVARLRNDQLLGDGEIVFIDLGKNQGIKRGNILHVVRRGDAIGGSASGRKVGQNNRDYPSRSLGTIIIVDVGRNASTGLVVSSNKEFEVGDQVLLRKGK